MQLLLHVTAAMLSPSRLNPRQENQNEAPKKGGYILSGLMTAIMTAMTSGT
jgi:hypothetical protein